VISGGWHGSSPPDFRTGSAERSRKKKKMSNRQQHYIYPAKERRAYDLKRYPYALLHRECPLEH
jgi:hypothetical protein